MALKSALKAARQAQRRREANRHHRSSLGTALGKARQLMAAGEESAPQSVAQAITTLDRAARKGVIHPNAAARLKSRLMKRLHRLATGSPGLRSITI